MQQWKRMNYSHVKKNSEGKKPDQKKFTFSFTQSLQEAHLIYGAGDPSRGFLWEQTDWERLQRSQLGCGRYFLSQSGWQLIGVHICEN